MGRPISFLEFKRKMIKLGVTIKQASKATHFKLSRKVGGETLLYVIAKHGNEVKACYIDATKKRLQISDEEFDEA